MNPTRSLVFCASLEPVETPFCLMLCVALLSALLFPPLVQEEKDLELFMDTFFVLGAEAPNCIPQMPSTPHLKASMKEWRKGWPQSSSVMGTQFQPNYEIKQGLERQAWCARRLSPPRGKSWSLGAERRVPDSRLKHHLKA